MIEINHDTQDLYQIQSFSYRLGVLPTEYIPIRQMGQAQYLDDLPHNNLSNEYLSQSEPLSEFALLVLILIQPRCPKRQIQHASFSQTRQDVVLQNKIVCDCINRQVFRYDD